MNSETRDNLIAVAKQAAGQAYAPASKFRVGAAVLAPNGSIHGGCNVENASYGLTVCAERHAVAAAVLAGAQEIAAVAVFTDLVEPAGPCGACRQVLAEFGPTMPVFLVGRADRIIETSLEQLLPDPFTFASFEKDSR